MQDVVSLHPPSDTHTYMSWQKWKGVNLPCNTMQKHKSWVIVLITHDLSKDKTKFTTIHFICISCVQRGSFLRLVSLAAGPTPTLYKHQNSHHSTQSLPQRWLLYEVLSSAANPFLRKIVFSALNITRSLQTMPYLILHINIFATVAALRRGTELYTVWDITIYVTDNYVAHPMKYFSS